MTTSRQQGDTIEGERIVCYFRKISGPVVIAGTSRHRQQRAVVIGLPASAIVDKPMCKT